MSIAEFKTSGPSRSTSFIAANSSEEEYLPNQIQAEELDWQLVRGNRHVCRCWFVKEEDGLYSAIAANLPGVSSQGGSLEEAKANLIAAFRAALNEYIDSGMLIPWSEPDPANRPVNSLESWIVV